MRRGEWGPGLVLGALLFMQIGVDAPHADAQLAGPSQGALPPAEAAQTPAPRPASPLDAASPAGGGGGPAAAPTTDLGPMIVPIDGGNRHGVDAVGGTPPPPSGGGGGGGGGGAPGGELGGDPDAPIFMGPWFIRFEPPRDRLRGAGPAGTPEPTLGPGSPAPRR